MSDERAGLIASNATNAYDEESMPTTGDGDRQPTTSRRRSVAASVAIAAVILLAGTLVFLLAHDAVRAKALGIRNNPSSRRHRVTKGDARQARLGEEEEKTPRAPASAAERLVAQMTVVPGTENTVVGASTLGSATTTAAQPPNFLSAWASAPYWKKNSYISVHETPGSEQAKVVVTGHATDIYKYGKYWLASATHWGLAARLTGDGTTWNGWEDKTMGMKTSLHHIQGDPVVIASDTGDVYFSCSQDDIEARFVATGADMIASGETQLWPEVRSYFDEKEINEWKMKNSNLGDVGKSAEPEHPDNKPYRWPNAGLIMGRKSALLRYVNAVEEILYTIPSHGDNRFDKNCLPFKVSVADAVNAHISDAFYDDQLCLNAYIMGEMAKKNIKIKVDVDGSIISSPGGIDMDMVKRDPVSGRVYNAMTGKSPCAWHFNNPLAKTRMVTAVEKFPNYFISNLIGGDRIKEHQVEMAAKAQAEALKAIKSS